MKPGTIKYTAANLIPLKDSNLKCVVISYDTFRKGKLRKDVKFHWTLSDFQKAVFIRYEDGTVDMIGKDCLFSKPGKRV